MTPHVNLTSITHGRDAQCISKQALNSSDAILSRASLGPNQSISLMSLVVIYGIKITSNATLNGAGASLNDQLS